jgi:MoxR-like ATPase
MKASQAVALLAGKDFVTPQTVKQVAVPVLAHRVIVKQNAVLAGRCAEDLVGDILNKVSVPVGLAA